MMLHSKLFVNSVLLFTIPAIALYPQDALPRTSFHVQKVNHEKTYTESGYTPSYDEIIHLLEDIESGELEKKCTPEELDRILHLLVFLAKEGALPDDSEESLSLDDDIEELLSGEDNPFGNTFSLGPHSEYGYVIVPAILNKRGEIVLCKSWLQKQCKHVKHFVKKHKKALIIGTAVVVAAAIVVVSVAAASSAIAAAAGAAEAASSSNSDKSNKKEQKEESSSASSVPADTLPAIATTHEAPHLKSAIDDQIASFKETIVKEQFFQTSNPTTQQQGLSWEENGRTLGSLFAHDILNNIEHQIPYHPRLSQEVREIGSKYFFSIPEDNRIGSIGHLEIDRKFSTDYTHLYANSDQEVDFNTLSYQVRGEKALAYGYYDQAIHDL